MIEDGENMTAQPEVQSARERQEFEVCSLCGKDLYSLNSRYIGEHYMCYTCGMPIKHLMDAVNGHIVRGIVGLIKEGFTVREACIRAGVRHLDVKELTKFESLL